MITDYNSFESFVMNKLNIQDPEDEGKIRSDLPRFYIAGWTSEDTIMYLSNLEEVYPGQNEEKAIARMAKISAKYQR